MTRPSQLLIPFGYPNDDPRNGPGIVQGDFDDGAIGSDSLRTVAEMLTIPTFSRLEPEFQRRYIAFSFACWIETGLYLGVGTGWRSWDVQYANWQSDDEQFAHPMYSLHVDRGVFDVAYAIDTVPYDVLAWAHANCHRFGINFLEHIPHERHHCQPDELLNGGSQFNNDYARLVARNVIDLPYIGRQSLAAWLAADIDPTDPGDDEMNAAQEKKLDDALARLATIEGVMLDNTFAQQRTGYPSFFTMLNQARSAVFPNGVTDSAGKVKATAGVLAKRIAAHLGLPNDY